MSQHIALVDDLFHLLRICLQVLLWNNFDGDYYVTFFVLGPDDSRIGVLSSPNDLLELVLLLLRLDLEGALSFDSTQFAFNRRFARTPTTLNRAFVAHMLGHPGEHI